MSKSFVSCFLLLLSPKVYGMLRPGQNGIDRRVPVRKDPRKRGFAEITQAWQRPVPRGRPGEQQGGFSAYKDSVSLPQRGPFSR